MIKINAQTDILTFFHDFEIVNRRTGSRMALTQIGPTREIAAAKLQQYNFSELDFVNDYMLVDPAEVAR